MNGTQQSRKSYTLPELDSYLQHESLDDFSALPPITSFVFDNIPGKLNQGKISDEALEHLNPLCSKQLLLGRSTGEYTAPDSPVYLCLGGKAGNVVGLNCNGFIHQFSLDTLSYVDLEAPYRKLLKSKEEIIVLLDAEKRRLKAYTCYLFLKAGHSQDIEFYSTFKDDLRYASAWLAKRRDGSVRTARQKAASLRQKEEAARNRTDALRDTPFATERECHETPLNPDMARATSSLPLRNTRMPSHDSVIEKDNFDTVPLHTSKKRKFGESITELRRHLEAAGQHLLAVENEFTGMRLDPQEMAELKRVNAQQAKEIEKLKHQLDAQTTELLKAKMDISVSEQNTRMEKAAREEESKRRGEVEARLNKLLDAHKKMTAMFS